MRLGLFGGSFDPVHNGHLLLAETCREAARLDQVLFMPACVPPHKRDRSLSTATQRLEMLRLAIGGNEHFALSSLELDRGGVSYTVDTLHQLHAEDSARELCLLLGADSLKDLPLWREPAEICRLAELIVVRRPGLPPLDFSILSPFVAAERIERFERSQVEMPLMELSSTDLRQRAATGRSLRYRTPRAVEAYIHTHHLYQSADSS